MKNKILSLVFSLVLVFGVAAFSGAPKANAQVANFPAGCTSGIGYSVTTGLACSGTASVTPLPAGCSTALGYSTTNGAICSGGPVAIQYLAGCSSIYGYSTIGGVACNGTSVASIFPPVTPEVPTTPNNPGLPTTGAGGSATVNIALLLASGAIAFAGARYLFRKNYLAK